MNSRIVVIKCAASFFWQLFLRQLFIYQCLSCIFFLPLVACGRMWKMYQTITLCHFHQIVCFIRFLLLTSIAANSDAQYKHFKAPCSRVKHFKAPCSKVKHFSVLECYQLRAIYLRVFSMPKLASKQVA